MALDVSYFWLPGLAWLFKELKTEDGVILQQRNSKLALEKKMCPSLLFALKPEIRYDIRRRNVSSFSLFLFLLRSSPCITACSVSPNLTLSDWRVRGTR